MTALWESSRDRVKYQSKNGSLVFFHAGKKYTSFQNDIIMVLMTVLIALVSVLLMGVVLIQNPKGGGLSSSFGGGGTQQMGGVQKTTDFLDKSTWTLAILLIALILLSNVAIESSGGEGPWAGTGKEFELSSRLVIIDDS